MLLHAERRFAAVAVTKEGIPVVTLCLGCKADIRSVKTMCQFQMLSVIQCSFLHRILLRLDNIINSIY